MQVAMEGVMAASGKSVNLSGNPDIDGGLVVDHGLTCRHNEVHLLAIGHDWNLSHRCCGAWLALRSHEAMGVFRAENVVM